MTIQDLKNNAVQSFTESGSTTPFLDADCLLQFLFNKDKTWILLHRNENVAPELEADFAKLVQKRKTGLPVAYITGKKEFYGIEYYVTPDVLIPKPDTEILVEKAVEKISACRKESVKIIDVCSGSGCVGLSTLKELENNAGADRFHLTMTDLSKNALLVTEKNARNIFDETFIKKHMDFLNGDLLCGKTGFDFILSNPPYVPHSEVEELLLEGRN